MGLGERSMSGSKTCTKCHQSKPLAEFPPDNRRKGGRQSQCRKCKAKDQAERRSEQTAEEKAEAQAAYRAGMRDFRCAICGTPISDQHGICVTCQECVDVLGGLEGVRKAVRAVRYLTERAGR